MAVKKTTKKPAAKQVTTAKKTTAAKKTVSKQIRSKILDFVQKHKNGVHRKDIVKHLRVTIQKKDFDPIRDRGYYSAHFCCGHTTGYLMKPGKTDARYLVRVKPGLYKIAKNG